MPEHSTERPERVGVFGGTFDPIHNGHVVVAATVRHVLVLDRMLLVVANRPWQKAGRALAAPEVRLAMAAAAVADVDGVEASSIEVERGGVTYTADTLEHLNAEGSRELFLVVGADVAAELETWRRVGAVKALATLVLVDRPGARAGDLPGDGWRVEHVDVPQLPLSSTALRARAAAGLPLDGLVPAAAVRVIRDRGLYADSG